MKEISLERAGNLLDGNMPEEEEILLDADVKVIGESATDRLFVHEGEASISRRSRPAYEDIDERDYVISGSSTEFYFNSQEVKFAESKKTTHRSSGRGEKLVLDLDEPEGYSMVIEDVDSIGY